MQKINFLSYVLITAVIAGAPSCKPPVQQVDYLRVSVPEEGGINFIQYTRDDENVLAPVIQPDPITGKLQWYAAPLLSISPDGERLAYIGESNNFNNLYLKEIAGGRSMVQRTFNRNVMDMTFSPDGSHLAFTSTNEGDANIYMINATEGAAIQQITSTQSKAELGPQFSPNGEEIFFTKQEGNRFYIWKVNLTSALFTQYSEGFTPNITPEGNKMIVTRNSKEGTRGEIWMIDLKLGTETLILNDPEKGFSSPAIHPDGEVMVCVGTSEKTSTTPQNLNLYLVKTNGTGLKQLTFHGGHDVSPQWSPDGKSLFFLSQRGNVEGEFNIWKFNVNL